MTKHLRKARMLFVLLLLMLSGASQSIWAQISISDETKYIQHFNSLANSGTTYPWTNNSTIQGWYSKGSSSTNYNTITSYTVGTGSSTTGALYSFGTNSDRAIGSVVSNNTGPVAFGVQLKNNADKKITAVKIRYTGEQWRYVHNVVNNTPTPNPQKLEFMYAVSEAAIDTISNTNIGFALVPALDFESPVYTTATAETMSKALDGNLDANRRIIEHTFNVDINIGQHITLKWLDANDPGSDHGLAIDDFELAFIFAAEDQTPPSLVSLTPLDGAVNVATNSNLSITFDEAIVKGSGFIELYNATTGNIAQSIDVASETVTVVNNKVDVSATLHPGVDYYVVIPATAFKDEAGNYYQGLLNNASWNFSTAATATPVVTSSIQSLYFGYTLPNKSKTLSFDLRGTDIVEDVVISANDVFTLATEESGTFTNSLTLSAQEVEAGKIVYARYLPTIEVQSAGLITISTAGASDVIVKALGTSLNGYNQNFNSCTSNGNSIAGGWIRFSEQGDQVWNCTSFGLNSTTGIQINGYSGGSKDNLDYLISPSLDLTDLNVPIASFWTKSDFTGMAMEVKISTNYDGISHPNTATWTSLPADLPAVNSGIWKQSNINLSDYKLPNVHIAFVYTSSISSGASRWSVDEFVVNTESYFLTTSNLEHSFGIVEAQAQSASKAFNFSILGLEQDLTVSVPTNFKISKDGNTFEQSITYSKEAATNNNTFFIRFTPTIEAFVVSGAITFSSGNQLELTKGSLVGSSKSKSSSLDIVSWNVEWFGADKDANGAELGPADEDLQFANVKQKILALDADIFALQEIANDAQMERLVYELPEYSFVKSDVYSYSIRPSTSSMTGQKLYFVFKTATVKVKSEKVLLESLYKDLLANTRVLPGYNPTATGTDESKDDAFWSSGRLPYMVEFEVTINGIRQNVHLLNVHARANSGTDITRYNMRKYDLQVLKDTLDAYYPNANLVMLGDYNDDVDISVVSNLASTYKPFVDDFRYKVLTYDLSTTGVGTYQASSFLDHITVTGSLINNYVTGSVQIESGVASSIPNYFTTTSDHLAVSARFELTKQNQTISFGELAEKTFGDEVFELTASSTSGLTIAYTSSDESVAKIIEGNKVEILKAGTVTITASQNGDEGFYSASPVAQTLTINKAAQTITFEALAAKTYGDAPFALSAASNAGLTVAYTSSDATVAKIVDGNTVEILKAGTVTITAIQAGNENYEAASSVEQTLTINKAAQAITFEALAAKTYGDESFNLSAEASSKLAVNFEVESGLATINNNTLTITGAGLVTIKATQSGNENYAAASPVVQSFCVNPAKPTIIMNGAELSVNSQNGVTAYQWYLNGTAIDNANEATYEARQAGTYTVIAKAGTCISVASEGQEFIVTAVSKPATRTVKVVVYPNPTSGAITIVPGMDLEGKSMAARLVTVDGKLLLNAENSLIYVNEEVNTALQKASAGVYILQLTINGELSVIKVLKQ